MRTYLLQQLVPFALRLLHHGLRLVLPCFQLQLLGLGLTLHSAHQAAG